MTSLLIKDLSHAETLTRDAASAVCGGIATMMLPPSSPGIAPGGCYPQPLPPAFAAMPSWMTPFWAREPEPKPEPDTEIVNLQQHQSTTR